MKAFMSKFIVCFYIFLYSEGLFAMTPVEPIDSVADSGESVYSVLHGDVLSYSINSGKLDTSLGSYQISGSVRVVDRVGSGDYSGAKVSLKFRSDSLVEVILYK